jgi:hypothetical protein
VYCGPVLRHPAELLSAIDLRAALDDGYVKAMVAVGAVGYGLVESAMRSLGNPGGAERHLVKPCAQALLPADRQATMTLIVEAFVVVRIRCMNSLLSGSNATRALKGENRWRPLSTMSSHTLVACSDSRDVNAISRRG